VKEDVLGSGGTVSGLLNPLQYVGINDKLHDSFVLPRRKIPRHPLDKRVGLGACSESVVKRKEPLPLPGIELGSVNDLVS